MLAHESNSKPHGHSRRGTNIHMWRPQTVLTAFSNDPGASRATVGVVGLCAVHQGLAQARHALPRWSFKGGLVYRATQTFRRGRHPPAYRAAHCTIPYLTAAPNEASTQLPVGGCCSGGPFVNAALRSHTELQAFLQSTSRPCRVSPIPTCHSGYICHIAETFTSNMIATAKKHRASMSIHLETTPRIDHRDFWPAPTLSAMFVPRRTLR